jgi:FkbM family methyltransferase
MKSLIDQNPTTLSLQTYGEWAEQELDLLSGLVVDGQTVLEFGSDFGAHTLWLAQAVGESGKVYVAEPRRLDFQLTCANLALNGLLNVHTDPVWLGRQPGNATLNQVLLAGSDEQGERVRVSTVDSMDLEALHLLKVNLPGTLVGLLTGADEAMRRHRPHVYFRLGSAQQTISEIAALKELGYRCWSHLPYLYNADNFSGHAENVFPGCVHQNVLATPIEGRLEFERLHEI